MHLSLSNPNSISHTRVRYLIAMWGFPGAAFLGGDVSINPPVACCFLLLSDPTDEFLLLSDPSDCLRLLSC